MTTLSLGFDFVENETVLAAVYLCVEELNIFPPFSRFLDYFKLWTLDLKSFHALEMFKTVLGTQKSKTETEGIKFTFSLKRASATRFLTSGFLHG